MINNPQECAAMPKLGTTPKSGRFSSARLLMTLVASLCTAQPAAAEPSEVLIWYANETAPDAAERANYDAILQWLDSIGAEKATILARGLRNELTLFPAAVDEEQAAIESAIARHRPENLQVMLFTNRMVRSGRYYYWDGKQPRFADAPISIPPTDHYILASNPLTRPEAFEALLGEAARRFDPHTHRFVLVTKSHGGPVLAITVRLPRRHEEITRDQLIRSLEGDATNVAAPPTLGIAKREYFAILERLGRTQNMQFSLVFSEACRNIFAPGEEQNLPRNVDLLYASGDRYMKYSTLDYSDLLARLEARSLFSKSLDEFLAPRYLALYRAPSERSWLLPTAFFVPFVAIILWFANKRWRGHAHCEDVSSGMASSS